MSDNNEASDPVFRSTPTLMNLETPAMEAKNCDAYIDKITLTSTNNTPASNMTLNNVRLHRYQATEIYNTNPAFLTNDIMLAYDTLCCMALNKQSLSIVEQPGSGKTFFLKLVEGISTLYPFEVYFKLLNILPKKDNMIQELNQIVVINLNLNKCHAAAEDDKDESEDRILYHLSKDLDRQIRRKIDLDYDHIERLNKLENEREHARQQNRNIQSGLYQRFLAYLMDQALGGGLKKKVYTTSEDIQIEYAIDLEQDEDTILEQNIKKLEQDSNVEKTTKKISTIVVIVDGAEILHSKGIESEVLRVNEQNRNFYLQIAENSIRRINTRHKARMRFLFSLVMKMSTKVNTSAPYIEVKDFIDVLAETGKCSYGTFRFKQFLDIAKNIGQDDTKNKLYNLKEEVKTNRRAITKYLDKDISTKHKTLIHGVWDYLFKEQMYSGGNIKPEHDDNKIIKLLYFFFMKFTQQLTYECANDQTVFTKTCEHNKDALGHGNLPFVKLNTDYFVNFLMKETDENSFSLKASRHISSGVNMDYFWSCFHDFVENCGEPYFPYELNDEELSMMFLQIDELPEGNINEAIHYLFRLGYVIPVFKNKPNGDKTYELYFSNLFHEGRIPEQHKNYTDNYANVLNLSSLNRKKLKQLFTRDTWTDILTIMAGPMTEHYFGNINNTFSEKEFELVFIEEL